jgi:hypothetical protein
MTSTRYNIYSKNILYFAYLFVPLPVVNEIFENNEQEITLLSLSPDVCLGAVRLCPVALGDGKDHGWQSIRSRLKDGRIVKFINKS